MSKSAIRFRQIAFALLGTLCCAACENPGPDESQGGSQPDGVEFILTTSGTGTRTHLGEQNGDRVPVYWSEGDRISVNGTVSKPQTGVEPNQTTASFHMRGVSAPYRIVYPADSFISGEDGSSRVVFPSAQTYTEGTFAAGSALMYAYSEGTGSEVDITLRYLCGVLRLPLKSPTADAVVIREVTLTASGGEPLAGSFDLDFTTGELTPSAEAAGSVTVGFGEEGLTLGALPVDVYVTLPQGVYSGIDIRMVAADGKILGASWGGQTQVEVRPGEIVAFGQIAFNPTHYDILTADDWQKFAEAANDGDYSEWVDPRNGAVNLRADIATETQFLRISREWAGTFDGHGHTITQAATTTPLFTTVTAEGTVKDFVLEGTCTRAQYPASLGTAAIAQYNYGTIERVTNRIDIELKEITAGTVTCGMVGLNAGLMSDCVQEGDITVSYKLTSSPNTYAGGLACFASNYVEHQDDESGISVGRFVRCVNKGDIRIDKSGKGSLYLGKFTIGGICAIVHQGTAEKYAVFEECVNEGNIHRRDDQSGANTFSCVGGIVGRVAEYASAGALGVTDKETGFYAEIVGCRNSGTIENAAYLTGGFPNVTVSGARTGPTGGIVGYARGLETAPVRITRCTNTGAIRGGQSRNSILLGGILGMSSHVRITDAAVDAAFGDATLPASVPLTVGTVGGIVGYVRHDTSIENCSVHADIDMQATLSYCGLCVGGVYAPATGAAVATVTDSKFGGKFDYASGSVVVEINERNFENYLCAFGQFVGEGVTYWDKN